MQYEFAKQQVVQKMTVMAEMVEKDVDEQMDRLENLDEDGLDAIREKRKEQMKAMQLKRQKWISQGHGEYSELAGEYEEKEFFKTCKESRRVIIHFFRGATERCKIVDMHLMQLAPKHMETKFIKIDAEKCPFLVEKFRIFMLPTITLIKEGKVMDHIVGFDDFGGEDDFSTEMMEWRLACGDAIYYDGDLNEPPIQKKNTRFGATLEVADDDFDEDSFFD
jgi:hypothetical protein